MTLTRRQRDTLQRSRVALADVADLDIAGDGHHQGAAALVAQRREVDARAARKDTPAAWKRGALEGITAEVTDALTEHPDLDTTALADLVEPPQPPAPSAPTRPEDATQRAAAALATKDRRCPHCHGSNNWLDDNGLAHECDHHP